MILCRRAEGREQRAHCKAAALAALCLLPSALCLLLSALLPSSLYAQDLNTQLIDAAMRGDATQIKGLLNSGAKPNEPDGDQRTPLAYAAAHGSLEAVK